MTRKTKLKMQLIFSKFLNVQPSELEDFSILDVEDAIELAKEEGFFKPQLPF